MNTLITTKLITTKGIAGYNYQNSWRDVAMCKSCLRVTGVLNSKNIPGQTIYFLTSLPQSFCTCGYQLGIKNADKSMTTTGLCYGIGYHYYNFSWWKPWTWFNKGYWKVLPFLFPVYTRSAIKEGN